MMMCCRLGGCFGRQLPSRLGKAFVAIQKNAEHEGNQIGDGLYASGEDPICGGRI